ncbi:MAG: Transcriptional regulator, IclR family [Atribacteria bacterium 34_128]|nr:MAG: Transcriptional regulator, IclR family [Atribacteria bacterium 34_128]
MFTNKGSKGWLKMAEKRKNINIRRTAQVLKAFSEKPKGWGVTELSSHLGLAKSVTHGILRALLEEGLLKKDKDKEIYTCGKEILKLALFFYSNMEITKIARPRIKQIVKKINETVLLIQYIDNKVVVIDKVVGDKPLQLGLRIGVGLPLLRGVASKIFLAFLPDEKVDNIISRNPDPQVDITKLKEDLKSIREKGYAISDEEIYKNILAVGAPIFNKDGKVEAVISTGGLSAIYKNLEKRDKVIKATLTTAKEISSQMGFLNWKW